METVIYFESANEFLNWLIDNEDVILHDFYGRRWMYSDFVFMYSDIGEKYFENNIIDCIHLYGEGFKFIKK